MDALCALLDCALGFFPCYFLFGCNRLSLYTRIGSDRGKPQSTIMYTSTTTYSVVRQKAVQDLISQQPATSSRAGDDESASAQEFRLFVEDRMLKPLVREGVGCIVCLVPASSFHDDASLQGGALEPCPGSRLLSYLRVRCLPKSLHYL